MTPSGIITLTTDFGLKDPYVAMMKGVILSINPDARTVDISHQVRAGSVLQAAFIIRDAYSYFPPGTVHVAVVDPSVGSQRRLLALEAAGHVFVGPDNGIFWPIIQSQSTARIVHLKEEMYFLPRISHTFHGREIFAPVAAHISRGLDLEALGPWIEDPIQLGMPAPYEKGGILYGQVMQVDHFGNVITNIHRRDMESFLGSLTPVVEIGDLVIKTFGTTYADVEEGQTLALINSSERLEVAVNLGRASDYIEVDAGEIIGTVVSVRRSGHAL